mmetsp:Transcript_22333/g.61935  ORF Transcript_22333/g.61935 Transcript_22333/m.61935 type:complete len:136 (+) Transcript_22333:395-802(+)
MSSNSPVPEFPDFPTKVVEVNLEATRQSTRCPICFGIIKRCRTVKVCLHRFCADCIEQVLREPECPNECPSCRTHIPHRRALHADTRFDSLIRTLYGDVVELERQEEEQLRRDTEEYLSKRRRTEGMFLPTAGKG